MWVKNKWLVSPKCDRQNEHAIATERTLILVGMHLLLLLAHPTHYILCIFLWTQLGKRIHTSFFLQTCQPSEPMKFSLPEVFSGKPSPALLLPTDLSPMPPSQRVAFPNHDVKHECLWSFSLQPAAFFLWSTSRLQVYLFIYLFHVLCSPISSILPIVGHMVVA